MSSHGYSLDRQNNRPNQIHPPVMLSQRGLAGHGDRLSPSIKLSTRDIASGRHRVPLSRFLTDSTPQFMPVFGPVRLASAPGIQLDGSHRLSNARPKNGHQLTQLSTGQDEGLGWRAARFVHWIISMVCL